MNPHRPLIAVALSLLVVACAERSPTTTESEGSPPSPEQTGASPAATAQLREKREMPRMRSEWDRAVPAAATAGEVRPHALAAPQFAAEAPAYLDAAAARRLLPPGPAPATAAAVDRENYLHYEDNGVTPVREQPVSTFSIDVDTASYANIRRMLAREGRLPPTDAVRVEEMINYFSYSYPQPAPGDQPFSIHTELAPAPWHAGRQLLKIGLKGYQPAQEQRPPANLVFLVDVSGSMRSADKLGLVKRSLRLLVNRLDGNDRIALAVYAGAAGTVLDSTPGDQKAKILAAIDALQAGGSTHGSAGIHLAYQLAQQHFAEGGINRVIIASDGDMNVGTVNLEALKDLVSRKRDSGIALTTLGFGGGNYNYALMEQLADVGNGNAAYIDSMKEAQKVLVNEMQSTLLTIASDVKIQVEFNPAVVSEYRLIGYENRLLRREDFSNDKVDAGEIGAGHTVTALYELVLVGSGSERIEALRYGTGSTQVPDRGGELAMVKLRYKQPGASESAEIRRIVSRDSAADSLAASSPDLQFAASVAGFGQLLRGGEHTGSWQFRDALALARGARGQDPHGYRGEFIHLIELAQSLSSGS